MERPDSNVPLSYAPPKRHIRRPILWTVVGLFVVIFGLGPTVAFYDWIDHRQNLRQMYTDSAALTIPQNAVVYAENSDVAGEVSLDIRPLSNRQSSFGVGGMSVVTLRRGYGQFDGLCYRIQPARKFTDSLLYSHERVTRQGSSLLVAVVLEENDTHFAEPGVPLNVVVVTVPPIPLLSREHPTLTRTLLKIGTWPAPPSRTRFFHGQSHPTDVRRFTIPYDVDRVPGVIDGVLNDDLTVTLTVRDGPLLKPNGSVPQ